MIRKQLFQRVLDISKNGELLDKQMILKLVRDILSNTDSLTRRKYKYTYFGNFDGFCAKTDIENYKICFSIKTCYEEVNEYKNASVLEKNLHIIAIIFHEIEHLQEPVKIRKNEFEGKLISVADSHENYFDKNGNTNFDTYYCDPSEKIAFANSYKKLLEYLSKYPNFKKEYENEYININNEYIERLLYAYEKSDNGKYNIPLIDFILAIKKTSNLRKINFKLVKKGECKNISKIDTEKRFMYGLPVTMENVEELEKKIILRR